MSPIADNVAITAGAGTTIATDDLGAGGHAQFMKVMDGTLDSTNKWVINSDGSAMFAGNVASGATDSGNPVKVGGRYNATPPTLTDGQRGDAQLDTRGSLKTTISNQNGTVGLGVASIPSFDGSLPSDGMALASSHNWAFNGSLYERVRTAAVGDGAPATGIQAAAMMGYNGSAWDRMRGDTNGLYAQGNAAAGATDAGNPVKVGGRYNSTLPTLTTGQRGDLQLSASGELLANLHSPTVTQNGETKVLVYDSGVKNVLNELLFVMRDVRALLMQEKPEYVN